MDTSEAYIKMCEGAGEIQNLMPNGKGADHFEQACFYYNPKGGTAVLEYPDFPDGRIWLPRQDQLQKMMAEHWHLAYNYRLSQEFARWLNTEKVGYYENLSMEQLWLVFVMSEKYGKVWDGDKWTKH